MKQWQLDAAREHLLLEIHTLLEELSAAEETFDEDEVLRLSEEISLCLKLSEREGFSYSTEELGL